MDRFVREEECKRLSGLSRQTRWRLSRKGQFPKRYPISPGISAWLSSEIADWLKSKSRQPVPDDTS